MINQKVKPKNGTFKGVEGTVIAAFTPEYFLRVCTVSGIDETWSQTHPGWREVPVVLIKFDEARKSATFEEWVTSAQLKGIICWSKNETLMRQQYEDQCPVVFETAMPYTAVEE